MLVSQSRNKTCHMLQQCHQIVIHSLNSGAAALAPELLQYNPWKSKKICEYSWDILPISMSVS